MVGVTLTETEQAMSTEEKGEQIGILPLKKIYYTISEVCKLTGLEAHVLRYWESEFSQLRPKKTAPATELTGKKISKLFYI